MGLRRGCRCSWRVCRTRQLDLLRRCKIDEREHILYPICGSPGCDRGPGPPNRRNLDLGMGAPSCRFWNDSSMDIGCNSTRFQTDPTDQTHNEPGGTLRTLIAATVADLLSKARRQSPLCDLGVLCGEIHPTHHFYLVRCTTSPLSEAAVVPSQAAHSNRWNHAE